MLCEKGLPCDVPIVVSLDDVATFLDVTVVFVWVRPESP
jgi:hypothetical protein